MTILVVMDVYVPSRISAALLMRDFVLELREQGHTPVVLVPSEGLDKPVLVEVLDGTPVIRVAAPRTKDVGKVRRALAEWWLPRALLRGLARSPYANQVWDGVVWYSPTIFLAPLVQSIKQRHGCRSYLILRDLFPDWALDAGVLRDGPIYRYFKRVERAQYTVADVIGVQTPANAPLVRRDAPADTPIEVLNNWMAKPAPGPGSIALADGPLAGRTIFAYTGNMGAAQGMDALLDLAVSLRDRRDIGFLFVGRGTDLPVLKSRASSLELDNVHFIDEVDSAKIPGLLAQCHVGLIALDPRHRTHNIPGKLITYLHAGLPVLARINPGNDLQALIDGEDIGFVVAGDDPEALRRHALALADDAPLRSRQGEKGREVAVRWFSPQAAASQVVRGLRA
ncbi:MAG: glycosyltransferase WbuB [Lysobacteraceae bacterium]|nr:MAG: glycosyltransferase WbuB [Xanthomonadaceae bacterium]